jgi:arginase
MALKLTDFSKPASRIVSMLGIPLSLGQPRGGVEKGVDAITSPAFLSELERLGWKIDNQGNVKIAEKDFFIGEGDSSCKYLEPIGVTCSRVSDAVFQSRSQGHFALNLGGDHSIAMGTVSGVLRAEPETAVIWVDAHADINTPEISDSGNVHGMPVGFLMDLHNAKQYKGAEWMSNTPLLKPERLVYIGLREVDECEKVLLKELNILAFSLHELDRYGIHKCMEMALDHVSGGVERPIHCTYDVDACDPVVAPGTGTRALGGLTFREAIYIPEYLHLSNRLMSLDVVEVNPAMEVGNERGVTAKLSQEIIYAAMGKTLL